MKALIAILVLITTVTAVADITKIEGMDAQNVCAGLRSVYALQTQQLALFPLAQVVQLRVEKNSLYSFVLGNEEENITCTTKNVVNTMVNNQSDVLKIKFNPEVSLLDTDRTVFAWMYYKAFYIQGTLADTVCAQLEMFNISEDQAELTAIEQVVTALTATDDTYAFGLENSLSVNKVFACGLMDSVHTFQIPSVDGW